MSNPMVALVAGEVELDDLTEVYWRQCAPWAFDDETQLPRDALFRVTDADGGKLSGARSKKSSPETAYLHRTTVENKPSVGTWGVPLGVVRAVGSRVVDDSGLYPPPPPIPPPGHSYVDVRHLADLNKRERQRFRSSLLIASFRAFPEASEQPE